MIKGSIQQEELIIENTYASHTGVPKYTKQILTKIKGEIDNNTITVGNSNNFTYIN